MTKRILIDGVHAEESRVVVADGDRLEEFDFENIEKKQIKNSIYLGKITRIEPSLQAAFVEYGGNRQGFLPFSEIHPDYFHIPLSDQENETSDSESGTDDDTSDENKNKKNVKKPSSNKKVESKKDTESSSKAENKSESSEDTSEKDVKPASAKKPVRKRTPASKKKEDDKKAEADNENPADKSIDESLSDEDENNTIAADAGEESKSTTIKIDEEDSGNKKKADSEDKDAASKKPAKRPVRRKKKTDEADDKTKAEAESLSDKEEKDLKGSDAAKETTKKKPASRTKSAKKTEDKNKVIGNIDVSSKKKAEFLARRYSEKDWLADDAEDKDAESQPPAGTIKKGRSDNSFSKKKDTVKASKDEVNTDDVDEDQDDIEVDNINDDVEETGHKTTDIYKKYKIQEVLKRGQVILVQVIKEERGNKGASLTSYISLAGRYCVLMPNSEKSGGVSRRISDVEDRKRLKKIVDDLDNAEKMSVIVRTAGINKEQAEIERDYNNLRNLWRKIKTTTMDAQAPEMIYEDGNLIKSTLRDMYKSDVEEIIVEGEKAYQDAVRYMEMMAPEDVHKVKLHKENKPLFKSWNIESQLDELYNNEIILPSGGSIVISPTEALVSIDVNSGRATKEKNIEDTAVKTNIEAAAEVARQLRLRDLAGLVVIDFIDMRDIKNRRTVEKAMKDALKVDRAKIQVGRISLFGLMEMSRQRMRSSIVEASSITCPHCRGNGVVRSNESVSINLLRAIEAEASKSNVNSIVIKTSSHAALYLLNNKRTELIEIEKENGVVVEVVQDQDLLDAAYVIDRQRKGKSLYDKKPNTNSKYNKKTPAYRGAKPKYNKNKKPDNDKPENTNTAPSNKNAEVNDKVEKVNTRKEDDNKPSYKEKNHNNHNNHNKKQPRPPRKNNNYKDRQHSANTKDKPVSDDIGNRVEESQNSGRQDNSSRNETVVDANESSKIRNIWNKMTK